MTGHEVVIEKAVFFTATCICGWRGQEWETEIGAERDGDFHIEHPVLTGEVPAIPQENER